MLQKMMGIAHYGEEYDDDVSSNENEGNFSSKDLKVEGTTETPDIEKTVTPSSEQQPVVQEGACSNGTDTTTPNQIVMHHFLQHDFFPCKSFIIRSRRLGS